MMKNTEKTMEKIVALCKGRGFVYPGSEAEILGSSESADRFQRSADSLCLEGPHGT